MAHPKTILVTGATGYVGARLVPRSLGADIKRESIVTTTGWIGCRDFKTY